MVTRVNWVTRGMLCSLLMAAATVANAGPPPGGAVEAPDPGQVSERDAVLAAFGLRTGDIGTVTFTGQLGQPVEAVVTVGQNVYLLELAPHSIRAANYQLLAQIADGSIISVDPGPDR